MEHVFIPKTLFIPLKIAVRKHLLEGMKYLHNFLKKVNKRTSVLTLNNYRFAYATSLSALFALAVNKETVFLCNPVLN
jgi:hypothetical protein